MRIAQKGSFMKITDLLKKEGVLLNQHPADKDAAIDILVGLHDKVGNLKI